MRGQDGVVRFGSFEADLGANELRRNGIRLKLQYQPFRVLALLLQRPGEILTREELQQELWPSGTFVDYEQGLATAVNRARNALGDSSANPRFIETVARCGYRFIAPVTTALRESPGLTVPASSPGESTKPPSKLPTRFIALPFRVLRHDDDTDFLAYSLPDAISSSLSAIESLIVLSSLAAARFGDQVLDPKRIAAEAGVDVILTGTLLPAGGQIRVCSQLVDAASGTLLWNDTAQFSLDGIFQLQDNLANRIAQSLMLPLTDRERKDLRRDVPANARAYEYYLRANQLTAQKSLESMRLARDLYRECLREDPNYAPTWACIGRVYRFIEKFGEKTEENFGLANAAYQRAFSLNPDLTVAHNFYTSIEADLGHSQKAMTRLLQRAQFKRNDPELFAGLVQACRYCGELEASMAAHEQAARLNPLITTSVIHTHFVLCDFQKTLDNLPPAAWFYLDVAALASLGRNEEALARLRQRNPVDSAKMGGVQAMMLSLRIFLEGDSAAAARAITAVEQTGMRDPEALFYMARQLARLGECDRAATLLSMVIDQGYLCDFPLQHDPWLAPLHSCEAYPILLRHVEGRRREAHAAFIAAGGPQLLHVGIPTPGLLHDIK